MQARKNTISVIDNGIKSGNLAGAIQDSIDSKKSETPLDFREIHYNVGPTDEDRYVIKAGGDDIFSISAPNILNEVTVKARLNTVNYKTPEDNPLKFDDAINRISYWLRTNRSNCTYMWNEDS